MQMSYFGGALMSDSPRAAQSGLPPRTELPAKTASLASGTPRGRWIYERHTKSDGAAAQKAFIEASARDGRGGASGKRDGGEVI